jgi:hypothetical protein
MGVTSPAGNMILGFIDLFKYLQTLLHPLVNLDIDQNGNAAAFLR